MSSDTKQEVQFEFRKFLIGLTIWIFFVLLLGAVLAWGAEGHLETIFEREIPFYNLWMLCSLALTFFGSRADSLIK